MARGYVYGGGGLGDLAAVGQGLLGGLSYTTDMATKLRMLGMQEAEAERRARAERLATRLKAFELGAKHPEYADQLPSIFGGEGEVPDFGPQFTETAGKIREADKAISDFLVSGDLKPLLAAGTANPFVGQRLKGNEKALAAVKDARELMTNQQELEALQADAAKLIAASPGLERAEAVRRAAAGNARRVALLEKGHRALLPPELTPAQRMQYDPDVQGRLSGAREYGKWQGWGRAFDTGGGLADVYDAATSSLTGAPLRLRGYFGSEEPAPAAPVAAPAPNAPTEAPRRPMPGRTPADVAVDLEARKAAARETPERRADRERRTGLYERDVATRERELKRRQERDKEIKERIGATLKTFEALAIDTAKKAFPDDPVKQMALAEKLRDRLRGLGSIMGSGDKDTAQIEQEIRDEIAKAKGEFQAALPEAKKETGSFFDFLGRVWNAIAEEEWGAPQRRALPGRAPTSTLAPAAPTPALKVARDALVNALYPGLHWTELDEEQKQAVADRLSPQE